jgi:hypothetical protein
MPTKKKPAAKKAVEKSSSRKKPVAMSSSDNVAESPVSVKADYTPIHQWTHDGSKVLLVKCVDKGGKSHGDFQWVKSGPTICPRCVTADGKKNARDGAGDKCKTGGLFGWAWGLNLGGGKDPNYQADWLVFAADPLDVIDLGDKCKVIGECEVVYYGEWLGALLFTVAGREAWIAHRCAAADTEHDTGWSGAASATGGRGAASATGESGAASATGESGAASATGWSGAASATGGRGAASATGWSGAASATGESGAASATGESGAASATGGRGAASATGWRGAASATGGRGAAALTGVYGTLEIGPNDAGVCTADEFTWLVHLGAIVLHRWEHGHALLTTDGLNEGEKVYVSKGKVTRS